VKKLAVLFAIVGMLCAASFAQNENEQREEQSDQNQARSPRQGTTNNELAQFDRFLDAHAQIRSELSKNPKLIYDENYIINHPELAEFLHSHPGVKSQILANPQAFMNRERGYEKGEDRADGDITNGELANFDQFLDAHAQIRAELSKNPKLIDNENYIINHPELAEFLHTHQGVKSQVLANPRAFMRRERAYEQHESRR
jgi:phage-related protein